MTFDRILSTPKDVCRLIAGNSAQLIIQRCFLATLFMYILTCNIVGIKVAYVFLKVLCMYDASLAET